MTIIARPKSPCLSMLIDSLCASARRSSRIFPLLVLLFGLNFSAHADDYEDGIAAFEKDDYEAAALIWRPLAEQGDVKAQLSLASLYSLGRISGWPDYSEAVKWYRLAAEQGDAGAQYQLGYAYENARGVLQDFDQAEKWYRLSAAQGLMPAQFALGSFYFDGKNGSENRTEAARWYRLAAEQGYVGAQDMLGHIYYNGWGVPQDYALAHMWWNLIAATGDEDAAKRRDSLAEEMTPTQIEEAQRFAREWMAAHSQ